MRWGGFTGVVAFAGLASSIAACSVVFSADDLSNGTSSGGGETSTTSSSSTGAGAHHPGCADDAACDDGDPCTTDSCDLGARRCAHAPAAGAACGNGTDCTPRGTCNAEGHCVPGEPDPARCDDKNPCTIDTCEASGCAHAANAGVSCNDGKKCDNVGTCNASGQCIASPKIDQEVCIPDQVPCPGNYYVADYHCDTVGCGECPLCVNAFKCTFACQPTFVACCNIGNGDCSAACPAGYHIDGASVSAPQCGCGSGTGVNCVVDMP